MRRFIRYLYEYEDGQRVRNVGFAKVEEKENSTSISIHGKGLGLTGDETVKLYIFYMDENVCRGIWQGDIRNVNPALNYRLIFTEEDTGRPENYSQIEGIILELPEGRKLAATWNDLEVNVNDMKLWDDETWASGEDMVGIRPQENEMRPQKSKADIQEEEIDTYINPTKPQFEKIDRRDIARLPRCEWRLANNSFLMHGYHNYHHLILTEDADGFWLGVPGIFHEREAKAAEAFGFPRFMRADDEEFDVEERDSKEKFGYWCRKVRRGM